MGESPPAESTSRSPKLGLAAAREDADPVRPARYPLPAGQQRGSAGSGNSPDARRARDHPGQGGEGSSAMHAEAVVVRRGQPAALPPLRRFVRRDPTTG
ncbi:hypothetical protein [Streptomyces sp. GbtcB7]|uniref:hypothetical protein n=1 Tax=Streptomyces sp. GbtcB7 TaxID=2824752 RepID=UPI0011805E8F|nr:hypothetical protein [Streptomyces sp. GbtcB7]